MQLANSEFIYSKKVLLDMSLAKVDALKMFSVIYNFDWSAGEVSHLQPSLKFVEWECWLTDMLANIRPGIKCRH